MAGAVTATTTSTSDPTTNPYLTLGKLQEAAISAIRTSETNLNSAMSNIGNGSNVSNADLLGYQMELSMNSLTASISSSIVKERSDTLKSVVQKF